MIELDKIYNMDCLEGMKMIPDGTVDCIICDLPYGTTACAWDTIIPFEPLWEQYKRIRKPNAPILLFGSEPFSTMIRMSNIKEYKYDWYWQKVRAQGFMNAKKMPLKDIETVSVFYGSQCLYNPQGVIKCNRVIKNGGTKNLTGTKKNGDKTSALSNVTKEYYEQEYTNYPTQVLEFSNCKDVNFHPTQKPVDLIRYLIRTYTNEGETVLDNTIGSGTTAIACHREHRHFIGFELNKEYYDRALKRIKLEQQQLTLF